LTESRLTVELAQLLHSVSIVLVISIIINIITRGIIITRIMTTTVTMTITYTECSKCAKSTVSLWSVKYLKMFSKKID